MPQMNSTLSQNPAWQSAGQGAQPAPPIPSQYLVPGKPLASLIGYSKANPSSSIANLTKTYIQSGAYDQQALKEGTDLSFAGRPSLSEMQEAAKPEIEQAADKVVKPIEDTLSEAADKTSEQYNEAAENIGSGIEEGAQKEGAAAETGDIPAEVKSNLETGLNTASGATQAIFAPVTGLVQAISDKLSDQQAVQDFATGNKTAGGILDLYDQLGQKVSDISAAHPEAAKNLGNAANVLLATMGGETEAGSGALDADIGESAAETAKAGSQTVSKAADAAASVAKTAKAGAQSAAETVKDIPGSVAKLGAKAANSSVGKFTISQYTGLDPQSIDFFTKHPEVATPEALKSASLHNLGNDVEKAIGDVKGKTVEAPTDIANDVKEALTTKNQELREHAFKYPTGSNSAVNTEKGIVKVDPDWLRKQIEDPETAGVNIDKEGRVTHGDSDSKINPVDSPGGARRMQDLWDTWGPKFATGKMTRPDFIRFRQSLAGMADYGGGFDNVLNKAADSIRTNFNKEYRGQIPGLENLDKEHTQMTRDFQNSMKGLAVQDPVTGELKMQDDAASKIMNATKNTKDEFGKRLEKLSPGILTKIQKAKDFTNDWKGIVDENGHLQENALNNIKNAVGKGRDIRLQKLEKVMPGITNRLKFIQAADDYNNAMGQKVGTYVRGGLGLTLALHNPVLGVAVMMTANPRAGLMLLRALGNAGKTVAK